MYINYIVRILLYDILRTPHLSTKWNIWLLPINAL